MTVDHVRSREALVQLATKGTVVHYFFFWGHRPLARRDRAFLLQSSRELSSSDLYQPNVFRGSIGNALRASLSR